MQVDDFMSVIEKLAKIEALIQRSTSDGERQAAQLAKERVLAKISLDQSNKPIEYRICLGSVWEKRLFVAICQKHGFQTYRYQRQKFTTARLRICEQVMQEILWPEYLRYARMLEDVVEDIMQELINIIHKVEDEVVITGEIELAEA
jgi:hypothetical protein